MSISDNMRWRLAHRLLMAMVALAALLVPATGAWARQPLAAIVVDARTGKVLYARDADAPRYPASITKVMTLYLLFRELKAGRISLKSRIRISRHAASMQPSKLWLKPGQSISVDQAIRALAVKSANDVAVAVAERLAGTESAFARRMTRMARALGMTRTTFRNASGLPRPVNVTTARDLATLSLRLMRDFPGYYRKYFSLRHFVWRGRRHRNHNRLLGRVPGMDGIKTGYTRAAGSNLAASVRRGGKRIVAVVLGASSSRARNAYMRRLIEMAFRRYPLASGSHIAALAGTPPGYSPARAQALMATMAPRRKVAATARRTTAPSRAPSRTRARPQVKVARISPAPRPEEAQALARLASAAAAMPQPAKKVERSTPPASAPKTRPPVPTRRPAVRLPAGTGESATGKSASDSGERNDARPAAAGKPKRPPATHPVMLATNVMVRVLEQEALEEATEEASEDAAASPAPAQGSAAAFRKPEPDMAPPLRGAPSAPAGMAALPSTTPGTTPAEKVPALRTQAHVTPDTLVITKASAPSSDDRSDRRETAATPAATSGNGGDSLHIIADDPVKVRRLLSSHWLIQIVATPSLDAAQRMLMKARKASAWVRGKPSFVVRVNRNGQAYYRARFAGFSKYQARRACKELKRRGLSCMLLAPSTG